MRYIPYQKGVTMKKVDLFAFSLALAGAVIAGQSARAQGANCADRAVVVDRLTDRYGETRQSVGLGQNNAIVEVFASDTTGTWTIIVTLPNGTACLVASGESWEQTTEVALIPGSDA